MIRKGMFIGDRYEVIDKVGSGGMSDVYKAKDHKLNRFVAVKVLKSEFCEDKGFVSKFKIEAQSAAGLAHPNIVNVYDVGEDQGIYYIVMELIEGITLKKYIEKKGKLPAKDAISIAIQVAQGIEAAHNNHIVHRDIKPQNIIISREGKVKVTDFGIARAASANTINSNAMGSVHYISPEQARGGYIDEKSDIYSLGITLYEMITGRVPFEGDSTVTIALQHIQEEIPSAKMFVPDLPISVEKIIEKCTQKKPERRYLKVSSLIADLKKSLITPDEDFVVIAPASTNDATIVMTEGEISVIKENAGKIPVQNLNDINDEEELIEEDDDQWLSDSDDIDEGNPKLDKMVAIGAIIAAIVLLIVAISVVSRGMDSCATSTTTEKESESQTTDTNSKNTQVPDVYGKTEEEAIAILEKATLEVTIARDNNDEVEEGHVFKQSIEAGKIVSKGTKIVITVSEGGEVFEIPDVIGKTYEEAMEILAGEYGLEVEPKHETNDEYDSEIVFKTNPEAPIKLKKGDKITIYISLGEEELSEVPDVVGKTKEDATAELNEAGFEVVVEEAYSDTVEAGRVISMDQMAGDELLKGNTVTIVVSLGEEPTESETETDAVDEFIATFSKFDFSDFDLPTIEVVVEDETTEGETTEGETSEGETTEGETTEGESTEGESTDSEVITTTVTVTTGKLTAEVVYKSGSSTITTDVTSQLASPTLSESFDQTTNIEVTSTLSDVDGEDAELTVYLTYDDNGEEKTVVIYTSKAAFN